MYLRLRKRTDKLAKPTCATDNSLCDMRHCMFDQGSGEAALYTYHFARCRACGRVDHNMDPSDLPDDGLMELAGS